RSFARCWPPKADSRLRSQPFPRGQCEVSQDGVGAGALERGQSLQDAGALVEPAALTCGLEHGVFPANLINGGWNPEGIFHAPDNVEIRKARLDHDHVGAFLQIQIYLPERLVRVRRAHLVAVLVAALEIARRAHRIAERSIEVRSVLGR